MVTDILAENIGHDDGLAHIALVLHLVHEGRSEIVEQIFPHLADTLGDDGRRLGGGIIAFGARFDARLDLDFLAPDLGIGLDEHDFFFMERNIVLDEVITLLDE